MRGQKLGNDIKEKAIALLSINDNVAKVSRELSINRKTVANWKRNLDSPKNDEDKKLALLREESKKKFISDAWQIIERSQELILLRLNKAIKIEESIDTILDNLKTPTDEISIDERKDAIKKLTTLKIDDIGKFSSILGTIFEKVTSINKENELNCHEEKSVEDIIFEVSGEQF